MNPTIPKSPGTYALRLFLPEAQILAIGRLGVFRFPAGDYLYLGSAFGPGGLHARLERHLKPTKRLHWHIDYLRPAVQVRQIGYQTAQNGPASGPDRLECRWSQALLRLPGACTPVPGFGAGDCRAACPAHLVFSPPACLPPDWLARLAATPLSIPVAIKNPKHPL
jgi:Uri superfamily endonuclease